MSHLRMLSLIPFLLVTSALLGSGNALAAEETVTIPKARLQELQRKEAELEKLKGDFKKTSGENADLKKQHQADAAKLASPPAPEPAITHVSPPIASLPPLKDGEEVEAMDLAEHYRTDAAAADQRYRKHSLTVRGEVAGFEKPAFRRDYKLILKTADRQVGVIGDIFPPDKYSAVFPVKRGSELVGVMAGETRVPITKVGDTVVVQGRCRGLADGVVKLSGCELKSVK